MENSSEIGNAVSVDALDKIEALLQGSDAGKIEYDKDGNAVFDDKVANEKYESAIKGDKVADVKAEETTPETEVQTQETVGKEADGTESPEKVEEETEAAEQIPPGWDDSVEIPLPDGRTALTLGEMKDELISLVRTKETVEKQADDLSVQRLIVNEILQSGGEVTPQRIKQIEQINAEQRQRDVATVAAMYPEWQTNEHKRAADFDAMLVAGKSLGATEIEMKSITKPWMIAMLKQLSDYRARENKAKGNMKKAAVPRLVKGGRKPSPKQPVTATKSFEKSLSDARGNLDGADWGALDKALR